MPSDPIVCPVCELVFEKDEMKHLGEGHHVCFDCYEENNLSDADALDSLLFDLADMESEV